MKSSNSSTGLVTPITVLLLGLTAIGACVVVVAASGAIVSLPGTAVAGSIAIDRDDDSEFFELDGIASAPELWWTVDLADDLSAYPAYTSTVDGDVLLYLTSDDPEGPGEIVLIDSYSGQRKWTARLDAPTSCTPIVRGQYLACQDHAGDPRRLRYVDLHTGTVTAWLSAQGEIVGTTPVDDRGTEFLVAVAGPNPGETTVHRGTPTSLSSAWSTTFRVSHPSSTLYAYSNRRLGTIGYGPSPADSATFDLTTGEQIPVPPESYDHNLWKWSDRTSVRVDPARRTFEIVDENGSVVGRGTEPGNHSGVPRRVGSAVESVILIGDSAYSASTGAKLWSDSRLMRADEDPLSVLSSAVTAIVDDTIVLELRADFPAGSMVGIDLTTGRELWQKAYSSAPVQSFLDDNRWVSILDRKLRSFDLRTGDEVWSVDYPGASNDPDSYDSEGLEKIDGRHVVATTAKSVTAFAARK